MNFSMGEGQPSSVLYFSQVQSFRFLLFPGAAHSLPVTSPYPPSSSITFPYRSLPVLFSSLAGRSLPFHHHSLNVPFPSPPVILPFCRCPPSRSSPAPPPSLPRSLLVPFPLPFPPRSLAVPFLSCPLPVASQSQSLPFPFPLLPFLIRSLPLLPVPIPFFLFPVHVLLVPFPLYTGLSFLFLLSGPLADSLVSFDLMAAGEGFCGAVRAPGIFFAGPSGSQLYMYSPPLGQATKNDQRTTNSTKRIQYIAFPWKSSYSRIGIVRKGLFLVYTCGRAFANCTCTVPPSGDLQKVIKRKAPATRYMQSQTNLEKGEGRKR